MKIGKPILTYSALIAFNILFACAFSFAAVHSVDKTVGVKILSFNDLRINYGISKFKAGTVGVVKPSVNIKGGTFSYTRINDGRNGGLSINTVSGAINYQNSNPGKYIVTYTVNSKQVSFTITVE
jgi:hypothetical protein